MKKDWGLGTHDLALIYGSQGKKMAGKLTPCAASREQDIGIVKSKSIIR